MSELNLLILYYMNRREREEAKKRTGEDYPRVPTDDYISKYLNICNGFMNKNTIDETGEEQLKEILDDKTYKEFKLYSEANKKRKR